VLFSQKIDPNQADKPRPFVLLRPFINAWQWLVPPTQAHRDRQSTTARVVAISSLVIFCGTVIVLGFLYAKPIQDEYQNWQAERLYVEALEHTNDKNYRAGWDKVQKAVQIAPDNINAIRLSAEYLTALKQPESIYFLDQLERHGATKEGDRVLRVRALMALQRPKEASEVLEEMLNKQMPTDTLMKLAEHVWGKSQKDAMLTKAMTNYAERHPDDREHALRLARVQIASPKLLEVSDGLRLAWKVAEGEDDLSLKALELLDTASDLPPDESMKLIQRLRNHPKGNGWHLVAALRRQVKIDPLRRDALILEAATLAKGRTRDDLVPLFRWLIEPPQNEYLKALSLITEDEAVTYQPLLESYLTALTALGRFSDLERLVNDKRVASILSRTILAFFRAHLAYVTHKKPEETRAALISAKNASDIEHRADLLQRIAGYAEERGHFDIAEEAFRAVALNPEHERIGFDGLIRMTKTNGNTEGLLASSGEAVRRWPDDNRYQEDFLYANLLTGRDVELAMTQVQKLFELQPKDHQRQFFVALAYWRMSDMKTATQYLNGMDLSNNHLTAGQQAVFAAIARDSTAENAIDVARQVLRDIDPAARMLPEERLCFTKAAR
jgi:tetratricopeptide (TPR) repeat protein